MYMVATEERGQSVAYGEASSKANSTKSNGHSTSIFVMAMRSWLLAGTDTLYLQLLGGKKL